MKNVRLASLPTDREVATTDCHTCTKRRIKCDRSLPNCEKCVRRRLPCPGYSLRLRWDQGVASRGKLAGKRRPVIDKDQFGHNPASSGAGSSSQCNVGRDDAPSEPDNATPGIVMCTRAWPEDHRSLVDRHLSQVLLQSLLRHFSVEVAPRLTWVDGPGNMWRDLLLPLSEQSPCIRLAMLSISAAHLSMTTASRHAYHSAQLLQAHHDLREAGLRILNDKMQLETLADNGEPSTDRVGASLIEMITAMLTLCHGEMLVPDSTGWRLHLHACRVVLDRYRLQTGQSLPSGHIGQFVMHGIVYLEVFRTMSTFGTASEEWPLHLRSVFDGPFWLFVRLLHEVTTTERKQFESSRDEQGFKGIDMGKWQAKLNKAYKSAMMSVATDLAQDADRQAGFMAVVRAHYYACLIYSHQALSLSGEGPRVQTSVIDSLFHEVEYLLKRHEMALSQNVFFPLFIAGTECYLGSGKQRLVETFFLDSISTTGLWCNKGALQFLQIFWARSNSLGAKTWIQFARSNEQTISPFLVY